jgi:hypothetical protein
VFAAIGCAGQVTPRELPVAPTAQTDGLAGMPFGIPGEYLSYDVQFRSVSMARFEIAVGEEGVTDGRRAIIVRSQGTSDGLLAIVKDISWVLTTTLDMDTGWPISASEQFSGVVDDHKESETREHHFTSGDVHNVHSFFGVLRRWDPPIGTTTTVRILVAGRFGLDLTAAGHEVLDGRPAVRIDGVAALGRGYGFTIWVADDAERPPLRVRVETKWGDLDFRLTRHITG